MKAYEVDLMLDPPEIVRTIALPSPAYGFSIRNNNLYSSALGSPVVRVNLKDETKTTMNAPGNYGIGVDQNGIAWYGGSGLQRCDFDQGGNCQNVGGGGMSGVAVDGFGQVWACSGNTVYKFANNGTMLGTVNVPNSYGIAIGHDNDPRVIGYYDAYKIAAGAEGAPPGAVTTYSTAHFGGAKPFNYTYTDFTGFAAQNISVKKGEWTAVYDSNDISAEWTKLLANKEPEGKIPVGTTITYHARAADTEAELLNMPWVEVADEVISDFVGGRFLEVRARLVIETDNVMESPVLSDICAMKI